MPINLLPALAGMRLLHSLIGSILAKDMNRLTIFLTVEVDIAWLYGVQVMHGTSVD
jgi:hypothetical protein